MARSVLLVTVNGSGHYNTAVLFARRLAGLGCPVTLAIRRWGAGAAAIDSSHMIDVRMFGTRRRNPVLWGMVLAGVRQSRRLDWPREDPAPLQQELRELIRSVQPSAVVLDRTLVYWASQIVHEEGLPKFILFTGASSLLATTLFLHSREDELQQYEESNCFPVPGLPSLRRADLPLEATLKTHRYYLGKKGVAEHYETSAGVLLNTSQELEGHVLEALEREHPGIRMIPIGPLHSHSYLQQDRLPSEEVVKQNAVFATNFDEASSIAAWLDEQPHASVVFICFGSYIRLGDEMIRELAAGMEESGFRFIWSLPRSRESPDVETYWESVLPQDFLERTSNRGKVIDFAPQQLILRHPAVGGFVSHCGWSSVVECILLAGVPILAWPFLGDQAQTCRHLVEQLRIAVDIGVDGVPSSRDVNKALRNVMEDQELRARAMGRRKLVRQAALSTAPGSSIHNLESFTKSLDPNAQ